MPKVEGGTRARFYRWHCNERFAQGFTVAQLAQTGHPRLAAAQHQTGPPELDSQVASSVSVAPKKGLQQSVMKELCDGRRHKNQVLPLLLQRTGQGIYRSTTSTNGTPHHRRTAPNGTPRTCTFKSPSKSVIDERPAVACAIAFACV